MDINIPSQPHITSQIQPLSITNYQTDNLDQGDKLKRHRRSKHEQEGRNFQCEHCGKSYLSKPALNNHMNTKHADILAQLNIVKRKRGRPRKYLVDPPDSFENIKFENYFNEEKRKPEVNEEGKPKEINKEEIAKKVFDDLYVKYKGSFFSDPTNYEDVPLLNFLLVKKELNLQICNDIMCKYIEYILPLTNEKYFEFIMKFLLLFKESVNLNQKKDNIEYTSTKNAEILPEQCNDFFSVFLENNHFFGFSEDEKNELIEIIQHFCYWLFTNNYTKSKLSLAG